MLRRFVVAAGTTLAASLLVAAPAAAQTGVLSGAVFGGDNRTGLEGATVTIAGTTLTAVTGKDGRFTIANVPAGDHELRIRRTGYAPRVDRVRVAASDTLHAYYPMIAPGQQETERLSIRRSEGGLLVIDGVIVDPLEAVQHEGAVSIQLRKGEGNEPRPLIIVDGVIMSDGEAFMKQIDPKLIDSVEVVKGESARAAYGERGANGVITITTKRRPPQL